MAVLGQGLVLMLAGMGIVYLFLITLIIVSQVTMSFIGKFDKLLPQDAPKKKPAAAKSGNDDENVALAIAVALG